MIQDLRFALRMLRRRPGMSLVAIFMLALGIGANAVVFSLVQALLLRPLAFERPDELVRLYTTQEVKGGKKLRVTEGVFFDWRQSSRSFDALVAARNTGKSITDAERTLNPLMREVSEGYFETLGVEPHLGRRFLAEEYAPGTRVVVLDFGFWQSYFGGDPEVIGRTMELAEDPYEVVGVMPAGHQNPAFPDHPVLWMPLPEPVTGNRRGNALVVIGRLADGVNIEDARDELRRITADLGKLHPQTDAGRGVRLLGLRDSLVETSRPALFALFGAVGFVMLMACANVANLLLARGLDRRRELGVRLAMGANRRHLLRQLTAEGLLLGGLAAGLGLLCASWAIGPLPGLAPSNNNVPLLDQVSLDAQVVLFTLGLTLATSLVFGLLPMTQVLRTSEVAFAGQSARGPERRRLRGALVVVEVALSLVLLVSAGLMLRSFVSLRSLNLGFEPSGLLTLRTTARGAEYGAPEKVLAFHRRALDDLARLPGVESVGASEILPMYASFWPSQAVRLPGQELDSESAPRAVPLRATEGFFETFGLSILRGRGFTTADQAGGPPVAVVSRNLARSLWGDGDPVGQELLLGEGEDFHRLHIVGLAGDLRGLVQSPEPPPNLYLPLAQEVDAPVRSMSYFLRTTGDPLLLLPEAEQTIWSISRDVPVFLNQSMEQTVRDIEWQPRFVTQLLVGFACLALLLAASGLYAVLSYEVAERTCEIGVRLAVGAKRREIVASVLGRTAWLTVWGLGLGLVGAHLLAQVLESQLHGVTSGDVTVRIVVSATLAAVALAASCLPAFRAASVDPVVALRDE